MATVEFLGETFTLREKPNQFAMLEFAKAKQNVTDDTADEVAAAMYDLIQTCIAADEWQRFRRLCLRENPDIDTMTGVIQAMYVQETERPTGQPGDSSPGLSETPPPSASKLEGRVTELFPGRPDQVAAVLAGDRAAN